VRRIDMTAFERVAVCYRWPHGLDDAERLALAGQAVANAVRVEERGGPHRPRGPQASLLYDPDHYAGPRFWLSVRDDARDTTSVEVPLAEVERLREWGFGRLVERAMRAPRQSQIVAGEL